ERGERSESGIRAHAAWQAERERVRVAAAAPLVRVATATEHAALTADDAEVPVEDAMLPGDRPHGIRFGTLVHGVLAEVDLDADHAVVAAIAALHGRLPGATGDEVDGAIEAVVHALAHPLLRRAAAASSCRREAPILLRLDDGTLIEGVADAAFAEADGWTVIDFKTDRELGTRLADYRRQVALHADAGARATGKPAGAVLLGV